MSKTQEIKYGSEADIFDAGKPGITGITEDRLFDKIQEDVGCLFEFEKGRQRADYGDWEERFIQESEKIIGKDRRIIRENLRNFRGMQIFVPDRPSARLKTIYHSSKTFYALKRFLNLFLGTQRGGIREALDIFEVLERMHFLPLLKKYPSPDIGNPMLIHHKGYAFSHRHLGHIYLLGLFLQQLRNHLNDDAVVMDIGSSYGVFSSLIKQELPKSTQVLVDMPGQLILAHYYLSRLFPKAKIAGFKEVGEATAVDSAFIKQFDIVLVPTSMFHRMQSGSVDLVTNFISFSEMSRTWFHTYFQSPVFKSSRFFYTVNRYDTFPTYHNGITFLDYPFSDFDCLYIRTCPIFLYYYVSVFVLGCRRVNYPSQFFQFIGKRKNK